MSSSSHGPLMVVSCSPMFHSTPPVSSTNSKGPVHSPRTQQVMGSKVVPTRYTRTAPVMANTPMEYAQRFQDRRLPQRPSVIRIDKVRRSALPSQRSWRGDQSGFQPHGRLHTSSHGSQKRDERGAESRLTERGSPDRSKTGGKQPRRAGHVGVPASAVTVESQESVSSSRGVLLKRIYEPTEPQLGFDANTYSNIIRSSAMLVDTVEDLPQPKHTMNAQEVPFVYRHKIQRGIFSLNKMLPRVVGVTKGIPNVTTKH